MTFFQSLSDLPLWCVLRNLRDQSWHLIGGLQADVNRGLCRVAWEDGKMLVRFAR